MNRDVGFVSASHGSLSSPPITWCLYLLCGLPLGAPATSLLCVAVFACCEKFLNPNPTLLTIGWHSHCLPPPLLQGYFSALLSNLFLAHIINPHSATSQKTAFFVVTTMKISNPHLLFIKTDWTCSEVLKVMMLIMLSFEILIWIWRLQPSGCGMLDGFLHFVGYWWLQNIGTRLHSVMFQKMIVISNWHHTLAFSRWWAKSAATFLCPFAGIRNWNSRTSDFNILFIWWVLCCIM
jgi:hypothetical protein